LPDVGILVVEIKGWDSPAGLSVIDGDSVQVQYPDKAVSEHPKRQARAYRFALSRYITGQTGFTPLVFDMVAYPFLDQQAYLGCSLDKLSDASLTFLKEDLLSAAALQDKIYKAICIIEKWGKPMQFNVAEMKAVRALFEPGQPAADRQAKPDDAQGQRAAAAPEQNADQPYSVLRCLPEQTRDPEIEEILTGYRQGMKYYLFTETDQLLRRVAKRFTSCLRSARLIARANDINPLTEDNDCPATVSSSTFTAFNFNVCSLEQTEHCYYPLCIVDGQVERDDWDQYLHAMHEKTSFNYNQYRLEHAPVHEHIEVQAGAGTGKTFSMVARFAFLCHQHQYHRQSITHAVSLLTFTNEAADVMKSRLKRHFLNLFLLSGNKAHLSLLEGIDNLQISTIHSYACELLRRFGSEIGYSKNLSVVSGIYERRNVLEDIIERHVTRMIDQDEDVLAQIDLPIYELKEKLLDIINKLYMKSIDLTHDENLDFGEVCPGYEAFHSLLKAVISDTEKVYSSQLRDSDQIHLNQIIVKVSELAAYLRQNPGNIGCDYLFIYEFQDTDDTQIKTLSLLQRLIGFKFFVVGDIKQCIYRFRGATISAFSVLEEQNSDEKWLKFFLDKNYRSDNTLLKSFNWILGRWSEKTTLLPYDPGRDALFSNIEVNQGDKTCCSRIIYANGRDLTEQIVCKIREWLLEIERIETNGLPLQETEKRIAILVRRNAQAEWLRKSLLAYGIEAQVKTGGELYQCTATLDFFKMVHALLNNQSPSHLAAFMVSGYVSARINLWRLSERSGDEQRIFLTDTLDRYFLDNSNQEHTFSGQVFALRTEPVLSVIRTVIDICRPWQNERLSESERIRYKDNLDLLLERILQRYTVDQLTLSKLWQFLSIAVMTGVEEQERSNETDAQPIICSTIHKAKGLEYGYVILPFTQDDVRQVRYTGSDVTVEGNRIGYNLVINQNVIRNSHYQERSEIKEHSREETRILYVAMTRAMRQFAWLSTAERKQVLNWDHLLKAGKDDEI
jgi:superfamily I DNA/RNA helicase